MSRFWEHPIVRNSPGAEAEHRHVTWLELFYDLAFVVAIAVVGHGFALNTTLGGLLTFSAFFIPIWWAWLGDAFYNNRFDPEDHGHQLLTIIQMFAIIAVAIFANMGIVDGYVGFALAYSVVRSIMAFLTFRVGKHNPTTRVVNYFNARWIVIAVVIWLVSVFTPAPLRYVLMTIAIAVDLLSPILNAGKQRQVPVNSAHLSQRFGFFVIIMLGEILSATVSSVNAIGPSSRQLFLAALSITLAFCVWWIYFENDYGPQVMKKFFATKGVMLKRTIAAGYFWTYAHLPLSMGIMALAVGIEQVIIHGPNMSLAPERITLLTLGTIVSLLSIGAMQIAAMQGEEKSQGMEHFKMVLPFISAILILILVKATYSTYPTILLSGLVSICLLQVTLQEVIEHRLHHHT